MDFIGYDKNEDPVFMFSHPVMNKYVPKVGRSAGASSTNA